MTFNWKNSSTSFTTPEFSMIRKEAVVSEFENSKASSGNTNTKQDVVAKSNDSH